MTGRKLPLSRLTEGAGLRPVETTGPDPEITGVALDSRRVEPGNLFSALRGLEADGLDFVPEALQRGAAAVLSEVPRPREADPRVAWIRVEDTRGATALLAREWHGRPDEKAMLVGVTGTNGKTSVTYFVESVARAAGRRVGRLGTVGYSFDGAETPAERTTPEATDLFRMLASMVEAGTDLVVMEVSSHALALKRVEGARFGVGAFLNFSRDHLDFHGDMDRYFAAKSRLIEGLAPDGVAVLTADEPRCIALSGSTRARVLSFGRHADAAVRLTRERVGVDGSEAVLETPGGALHLRTRMPGRPALDNAAGAAACALGAGLPADAIEAGTRDLERIPGRMEPVVEGQPFAVLVDYAHTEAALERVLSAAREMTRGRVIVVFGCGGGRDRGKRPAMGRVAASAADLAVLTSDNPRGEDPRRILLDIEEGVAAVPGGPGRSRVVPDRGAAVAEAIASAGPGDVVVLAGKGHETVQVLADRKVPMDDRDLARRALAAVGWTGGRHARA